MKKSLILMLCLILIGVSNLPSLAFAGSSITVSQTDSSVLVNGVLTKFEAYTINGNNYFKLRDIATVVEGTEKQFEVSWDNANSAINLLSGSPYTVVGGELVAGNGLAKTATLNSSPIYKDGSLVSLTAYTINGNNFFKLRDLTQTFDIGVDWDNATSTIAIDTSKSYVIPPVTPSTTGTWYTPKYPEEFSNAVNTFSEGYFTGARYPSFESENPTLAIYSASMELLVHTQYPIFGAVRDGLIAVGTDEEHMGYINVAGKEVIPLKYYEISGFNNGYAIVHNKEGGSEKTLVINTSGKVILSLDHFVYGDVRDNYVYIDETDPDTTAWFDEGYYYDFNGKKIDAQARQNTSDAYGYWDEAGDRFDRRGYSQSEKNAFDSKYAKLYSGYDYLGHGFFKVDEKISDGLDDWDAWDAQQTGNQAIVDKNNKVIVPMGSQDIEFQEAKDMDTKFFIVTGKENSQLNGVYSATGKKLLSGLTDTYYWYAGNNVVYYALRGEKGWGLISLTGTHIAPQGRYLDYFDPDTKGFGAYSESIMPPVPIIKFYTTANMQVKADTTRIKALISKANVLLGKINTLAAGNSDYNYIKNSLASAISAANAVANSSNPIWIDVVVMENRLLYTGQSGNNAL